MQRVREKAREKEREREGQSYRGEGWSYEGVVPRLKISGRVLHLF